MRRLDIGIASYENPAKLTSTLHHLMVNTWDKEARVWVIDNNSQDPMVKEVIDDFARKYAPRIQPVYNKDNTGYAGAVNMLFHVAESEYIAYSDNDAYVKTPEWDAIMTKILDIHHEIGILFPGSGPYPIHQPNYDEILWGIGCFWMIPHRIVTNVGKFDETIGHHEEVDFQTRVRLAGLKVAGARKVNVIHDASASSNPKSAQRISDGVVRWVTKWNRYFAGENQHYASDNVLRHEDWPPSALHMEKYWRLQFPDLNINPDVMIHNGQEYDLIRVPRLKGFYRGRVI